MILTLIIAVAFIGLGVLFLNGKGANLIAGYNTMPDAQKKKVNEKALLHFMGYMMWALSICIFIWALSIYLDEVWLLFLGLFIFLGITIFMLIYINLSGRFKK